jgi:hypothetical protein
MTDDTTNDYHERNELESGRASALTTSPEGWSGLYCSSIVHTVMRWIPHRPLCRHYFRGQSPSGCSSRSHAGVR